MSEFNADDVDVEDEDGEHMAQIYHKSTMREDLSRTQAKYNKQKNEGNVVI